jgi:hypothetical protein
VSDAGAFSQARVEKHASIMTTGKQGACAEMACASFVVLRHKVEHPEEEFGDDAASNSDEDRAKIALVALADSKAGAPSDSKHLMLVVARPSQWKTGAAVGKKLSLVDELAPDALVVDYWFTCDIDVDYTTLATPDVALQTAPQGDEPTDRHEALNFGHYRALATREANRSFHYALEKAEILFMN